jgi:methionyl-tRNA formyltransferase
VQKNLRIVFMGTPRLAVASLDILVKNGCNIVGVITAPDKPAGRGLEVQQSDVKRYAVEKGLHILQPVKLKDEKFLAELRALGADLQIVVAFRMLPETVWTMPPLGTFNLHASLLPQYRGAAPINWAIINGEKETGVTTFFLSHQIDTGNIIYREQVAINENETAGELHDRLMQTGAALVLKTVRSIEKNEVQQIPQEKFKVEGKVLVEAPKIFKEDCRINWNRSLDDVHNFIRGLSPYPAAFTEFTSNDGKKIQAKIFRAGKEALLHHENPGTIITDGKDVLKVCVPGGYLSILELQQAGKKRMPVAEFLRGSRFGDHPRAL